MSTNRLIANDFSNSQAKDEYLSGWPEGSEERRLYENGRQCGGCSFFAPFNEDLDEELRSHLRALRRYVER